MTARDDSFVPVRRPGVTITLRGAEGVRDLASRAAADGHAAATWQADRAGVYEIAAEARDGDRALGTASRFVLVGGVDPELTDPRLNEATLRRLADGTGGAYVRAVDAASVGPRLREPRVRWRRIARSVTCGTTDGRSRQSCSCSRPSGGFAAAGGSGDRRPRGGARGRSVIVRRSARGARRGAACNRGLWRDRR